MESIKFNFDNRDKLKSAICYISNGKTQEGFKILLDLYAKKFTPCILWLGRYYKNIGDYYKAEYLLKEALNKDEQASVDLALIYYDYRKYNKAINILEKNSSIVMNKLTLARIYEDIGDYYKAIFWFEDAIDNGARNFKEVGMLWYKIGNYKKAIDMYTKQLNEENDNGTVLILIGDAYIRNGDNELGCESFKKSLQYGTGAALSLVEYYTNIVPDKAKADYYRKIENKKYYESFKKIISCQ